jgi:hypothetical protein
MVDDPKMISLSDEAFRFWINSLCLAGKYDKEGVLGDVKTIAWAHRITEPKAKKLCQILAKIELFVELKGVWSIKNFSKRQCKPSDQADAVRERVRRHREKKSNTPSNELRNALPGDTEPVKRPVTPISKLNKIKPLKPNTTTTAGAQPASPVDNFSDPAIVATLIRVCGLNAANSSDAERCRKIDEALGDHFPDITPEQLESLYGTGGWWHKKHYPELAIPMPPAPEEVLATLSLALADLEKDPA